MTDRLAYFRELETALAARARAAGILSSSTSVGRAREILVSEFLTAHLPTRITVERGELGDAEGQRSGEIEVILVDHESGALRIGGESFVPVEAAAGALEVKTTLAGRELESAIKKVARLKTLSRTQHHGLYRTHDEGGYRIEVPPRQTNAYIVAYDAPSWQHVLTKIRENPDWYENDFMRFGPEVICVVGRGFSYKNDNHIFSMPSGGESWSIVRQEHRPGLEAILGHLQETLGRYGGLTYELTAYAP
jgi:hypothetical protein